MVTLAERSTDAFDGLLARIEGRRMSREAKLGQLAQVTAT
jgi:hypothetical protein